MKGYLYKELKQNRRGLILTAAAAFCAAFLPIMIVMLMERSMARDAFLVFARDGAFFRFVCIAIGFGVSLTMQGNVLKGDDMKIWGYFVASTPKGIKGFIGTKYAFAAAMCVIFLALSVCGDLIFTLIANVIGGIGVPIMANVFFMLFFVQLLLLAVDILFTIRFGAKRGSTIKVILLVGAVIILLLVFLFNPAGIAEFISDAVVNGEVPPFMKWVLPILSAIAYILSCLLSCKAYMKGVDEYYQ